MNDLELIHATDTVALSRAINGWIGKGWDLFGGLIPAKDEIAQWICFSPHENEYRLVETITCVGLVREVKSLQADRFEPYGGTLFWNGRLLQWVHRSRTSLGKVPPMMVAGAVGVGSFPYKPE